MSNVGRKVVGAAKHYYTVHTCIVSTINPNTTTKTYCYKLIQLPSVPSINGWAWPTNKYLLKKTIVKHW